MDIQERDKKLAEHRQALFKQPFAPAVAPERMPPVDMRVAVALEYIAAQLGTIARSAEKIESHLAKIADAPTPGSAKDMLRKHLGA